MRSYSGKLGGVPWTGRLVERPADLHEFRDWIRRNAGQRVNFDTESQGLRIYASGPRYLRLAQFGTEREAWVIPVEHGLIFREAVADALWYLPMLSGHNVIQHDGQVIDRHLGVRLEEFCPKVLDTMITSKLIDPRGPEAGGLGAGLKAQAGHYIDPASPDTSEGLTAVFKSLGHTKKAGTGWAAVPWDHTTYIEYSMLDVILGARLAVEHAREMERLGVRPALVAYEHEISRICAIMSRPGMRVDREYTRTLYGTLDAERERYEAQAARYGVENVNSNDQVIAALQGMGVTLKTRTDSGKNFSVAKDVLLPLADLTDRWERIGAHTPNPVAESVLHAQRAGKWRSAYVDKFLDNADENDCIHPSVNTLQARTGRMSVSGDLAAQTLPKADWMIRRGLLTHGEDEVFISTDFASVEMRVLAALADVKQMKKAVAEGRDLNDFTASLIYGPEFTKAQRQVCKGVGYGTIFGGGAATISRQTGAPEAMVRDAQERYHRLYPEIKRASGRWQREARGNGMVTISATGRRLPVDRQRAYTVVNYQCQSAARDCLGQAMIDAEEAGLLPYMRLVVHDEILASAPKAEAAEVAREFERVMSFDLRGVAIEAEADIGGSSWGSLYMKDAKGKYLPEMLIESDPYYQRHPADAWALCEA